MSNSFAIAAVTVTLRTILDQGVKDLGGSVTILPLDKAGKDGSGSVNLFLYQVSRNAAWANRDMPRQVMQGETGMPPLPLDLHYLITAFASDNDTGKASDHALLGRAMRVLHDHPVLSADDIRAATKGQFGPLPDNDLDQQPEHVRVTQQPLSIDELSKLWTGFGMQYRVSAAYQVGVTLIESDRSTRAPLPVLARGPDDSGVAAQPDLISPLPTLDSLTLPKKQASARLKETIALAGVHLDGTSVALQFTHPRLAQPVERAPDPGATATALAFTIPDEPDQWLAGFYTVTVLVQRSGENYRRSTNQLVVPLAPILTNISAQTNADTVTITANASPQVLPEQRAALLLADREMIAAPRANATDPLVFAGQNIAAGDYFVRLRVDGVDSWLVDKLATPPQFDPTQKVTVS